MGETPLFFVVKNMVWNEFCTAYDYSRKIRIYIDLHRKRNRYCNLVAFISAAFSAICPVVQALVPEFDGSSYASVLAAVAAIIIALKELIPYLSQPESELAELHDAATFYAEYFTEMEQLYSNLVYGSLHPAFCENQFFALKHKAAKYLAITNEFYRGLPSKFDTKVKNEREKYVSEIYTQN